MWLMPAAKWPFGASCMVILLGYVETGQWQLVLQKPRRPHNPRSPRLRNLGQLRRGEHYRQIRRSKGQTLHAE
jgi:hypothetical protein